MCHQLPSIGPKQLCVLAHPRCTCEAGTSCLPNETKNQSLEGFSDRCLSTVIVIWHLQQQNHCIFPSNVGIYHHLDLQEFLLVVYTFTE